jgi:hypothetical protein
MKAITKSAHASSSGSAVASAKRTSVRVELTRCFNHRGRTVDSDDTVTKLLQVTREPSFAAADIQRLSPRRRQETKKLVSVKAPVTIMSGSTRPLNPLAGLGFPADI